MHAVNAESLSTQAIGVPLEINAPHNTTSPRGIVLVISDSLFILHNAIQDILAADSNLHAILKLKVTKPD